MIIHAIEAPVFNVSNVTSTQGESVWITYANGNVNLNNIHVDRATDAGVYIDTAGEIIANNISATYNNIRGAILYGAAGVSLTGTNVFNHNVGDGLVISTAGSITLENVTASHNTATGAYLFGGTITITGTNFFDDNVLYGGEFYGTELSLDGVSFSGNDIAGLSATSVGDVTLNNVIASENTSDGIWVQSDGGNMVLSNLTASKNSSGATFVGASTVTLTGRNVFNDNSAMGLGIDAAGDIKVSNVTANSNSDGISLFSAFGAISIDG